MATNNKNFRVKNGLDVNGEINVSAAGGSEGGQLNLEKPVSGTTLSGNVGVDIYGNKIRFFEQGGSNRGAYIDLTSAAGSVGTDLLGGVTGAMNYAQEQSAKVTGVSSNATTIVSKSFTTNGYPVQVIVTGDAENNTAGGWVKLQLFRDSTAIGKIIHVEMSAGSENSPYALTVVDAPAAGTYTYSLKTVSTVAAGAMNFGETDGPVLTLIELSGPKGDTGASGLADIVSDTTPQLGGDLDAQSFDITNLNSLTFDTTPTSAGTAAGTIYWDTGDGIPKAILNANVTIGLGQESVISVKNATGSTITKGTVVYINGAQGQMPTVALADADTEATSSKTFGFAAEEILDTAEGFVVTEGVLRGVNTASFTEGGAIWLSSTAGQYTQTIPAEPAHSVFLGYAVKAHASAGEVIVKIQNGYELTELHGVEISGTPADNEVLAYDTTSGLWINQTAEEAGVANLSGATFTGNVAGTNANLSGNVNATTFYGSGAGLTSIPSIVTDDTKPATPVDGQVWFNSATGKTYVYYDDSTSNQWVEVFGAKDIVDLKNRTIAVESNVTAFKESIGTGNYIINGAFDIWQRGTSFTSPATDTFVSDRWVAYLNGTGVTRTFSQQLFTLGAAPVAGYEGEFFLRYNQSVAGTGGTFNEIQQKVEDVRTLAGQTVTLSFWARAESTTSLPFVRLRQNFGTGGSPSAQVETTLSSNVSVETSWTRYTYTTTLPSISGKTLGTSGTDHLAVMLAFPLNSTFTVDIWGVQLEAGSVATPFRRNAPSIQAELAACQRYYYRIVSGNTYVPFGSGFASAATTAEIFIPFPVTMRTTPSTTIETTGTLSNYRILAAPSSPVLTVLPFVSGPSVRMSPTAATLTCTVAAAGLTAGQGLMLESNNIATAYLGFSAEF